MFGGLSNKSNVQYSIRAQRGDTSTVTIYFDEVYARDGIGTSIVPYDLESVQVLKGPQGTLFGASATGGAIVYTYQKPTNELEGQITGSDGNYNYFQTNGVLNIPLGDQNAVRISGVYSRRDGYTKILSGGTSDGDDRYAFRLQWAFTPNEFFDNRLVYEKFHWDEDGNGGVFTDLDGYIQPLACDRSRNWRVAFPGQFKRRSISVLPDSPKPRPV